MSAVFKLPEKPMSQFEASLPTLFLVEGRKYTNDPNDPGGATSYGISLRFLKTLGHEGDLDLDGDVDAEDIKKIDSDAKAAAIYRKHFWDKNKYNLIADQGVATKAMISCVHMGSNFANKFLQRAVRAANGTQLVDDGILGDISFTQINKCDPRILHAAYKAELANYYRRLKKPIYEKGWLNRAYYG